MPIPAASDAARVLAPVRVVTLDGRATVRPVDHDAPAAVRARIAAHNPRPGIDTTPEVRAAIVARFSPERRELYRTYADAFLVLRTRDGLPITDSQIHERAIALLGARDLIDFSTQDTEFTP